MTKELQLLDQIIEMAEAQEKELKQANLALHKASRTVGDGALLVHLRFLTELMKAEASAPMPTTIQLGDKNFTVCLGSVANTPFYSPGPPVNADKLPDKLDIGLFVKVTRPNHTWFVWGGEVVKHYINGDDCSGNWGSAMYRIRKLNGEHFDVPAAVCTIL